MKFCEKCGSELADEAQVCMNCGCPVAGNDEKMPQKATKKMSKKTVWTIVIAAVAAIALIVGGLVVVNHMRVQEVVEQLAGKSFTHESGSSNLHAGTFTYSKNTMTFDENGELTQSYYYLSSGAQKESSGEYTSEYKIRFENGITILEVEGNEFEVRYAYGEITSLYDMLFENTYYD